MPSASFQDTDRSFGNHIKDVNFSQISDKRSHMLDSHVDIPNDNSLRSHPSEHTLSRIEHKVHLPEAATGGASRLFDSVINAAREAAASWGFKNDIGLSPRKHNRELQDDIDDSGTINDDLDSDISNVKLKNLSDVVIHRIRPTISTLGEGELSLASLDQRAQAKPSLSDHPSSNSETASAANGDDLVSTWGRGPITSNGSSRSHSEAPGSSQTPRSRHFSALHDAPISNGIDINDNQNSFRMKREMSSPMVSRQTSTKKMLINDNSTDQLSSIDDVPVTGERRSSLRKNKLSRAKHVTGFAFADRKRNKDFHRLFRTVPYSDYLLDDFSCALSREILLQGRLYVSEYRLCFYSNIIGWVTHLVISFDEIVSLEKKNTAGLFPNGIVVQTLHARYSLASFVSRDNTFEFIKSVWKKSNVQNGSKVEIQDTSSIEEDEDESDFDSDASYMNDSSNSSRNDDDEDFTIGDVDSQSSDISLSLSGSEVGSSSSALVAVEKTTTEIVKEVPQEKGFSQWPAPNLGPDTHEATSVPPPENTNEKVFMTGIIKAPLGVVANLLYGDDTRWMYKFLTEREKNTELADVPKFRDKTRKYEYIKPLHASMGPKSTKCICTETIEKWNMDEIVSALLVTQTPNVPSGNSFLTKSRTILTWGEQNTTKITASFWIEWSAKSWIKGPIEKGAEDGQVQSMNDLVEEINSAVSSAAHRKNRKKTKTGSKKPKAKEDSIKKRQKKNIPEETKSVDFSIGGLISSLTSMNNTAIFILIFLIGAIMGRFFFSSSNTVSAIDEKHLQLMRLRQEYELWKWIDDRSHCEPAQNSNRNLDSDAIFLHDQQQLTEIIKVTEHRLEQLKDKLGHSDVQI